MKERGMIFNGEMVRALLDGKKTQTRRIMKVQPDEDGLAKVTDGPWVDTSERVYRCPHGVIGDRIWVRETYTAVPDHDEPVGCSNLLYAADGSTPYGKWTPSIHMPRWASRILLEITDVRVERLNSISQADAIAEGAPPSHPSIDAVSQQFGYPDFSRSWFGQTWQHIYGEESWQANPFVWVISFRRIEEADHETD